MTATDDVIILDESLAEYAGVEAWHRIAWIRADEYDPFDLRADIERQEATERRAQFLAMLPSRYRTCTFDNLREHIGNAAAIDAARNLEPDQNLYLWGNAGNGKTHLALAIAQERSKTQRAAFWNTATLFSTLRLAARGEEAHPNLLLPETLILDDIGKVKATDFVFQELYRVLEERWSNEKPTIFTANHRPSDAVRRLADDAASQGAVLSRLASGPVVEIKGRDERVGSGRDPR